MYRQTCTLTQRTHLPYEVSAGEEHIRHHLYCCLAVLHTVSAVSAVTAVRQSVLQWYSRCSVAISELNIRVISHGFLIYTVSRSTSLYRNTTAATVPLHCLRGD